MEALLCLLSDTEEKIWAGSDPEVSDNLFYPLQVYDFASSCLMVDKDE